MSRNSGNPKYKILTLGGRKRGCGCSTQGVSQGGEWGGPQWPKSVEKADGDLRAGGALHTDAWPWMGMESEGAGVGGERITNSALHLAGV